MPAPGQLGQRDRPDVRAAEWVLTRRPIASVIGAVLSRPPVTRQRRRLNNTQVDNGGIDVRLTQLRNLLAGTRPRTGSFGTGTDGDTNFVFVQSVTARPQHAAFYMPNGVADPARFARNRHERPPVRAAY